MTKYSEYYATILDGKICEIAEAYPSHELLPNQIVLTRDEFSLLFGVRFANSDLNKIQEVLDGIKNKVTKYESVNNKAQSKYAGRVERRGYMYENNTNEELLNMLINANEVSASQETCEKLYNAVLNRMNADKQNVESDEDWHWVCKNCEQKKTVKSSIGVAASPATNASI